MNRGVVLSGRSPAGGSVDPLHSPLWIAGVPQIVAQFFFGNRAKYTMIRQQTATPTGVRQSGTHRFRVWVCAKS
jgi:hypothetical protein